MTRTVVTERHIAMDYPQQDEIITSPNYTLRFAASDETKSIEVSVDQGPWQPCRQAAGYFWFDWTNYMAGRHEIIGRAKLANGRIEESGRQIVHVDLEQKQR